MDSQETNPNYDVVVCGTGLIECILSGLLSLEGINESLSKENVSCTSTETPTMEVRVPHST